MSETPLDSPSTTPGKPITIAVFASSLKENEKRVPIHPDHFKLLPPEVGKQLILEKDYGKNFNIPDSDLAPFVRGFAPRAELFNAADAVLLPKPVLDDFKMCRDGQIIIGWCHFCASKEVTEVAIQKRLTALTFESMHVWKDEEQVIKLDEEGKPIPKKKLWLQHSFYKNNRLAGYAAVLHALDLRGIDACFGRRDRKCAVIGRGNCAIGAVWGLHGRGFNDITVFSHQDPATVDHFSRAVVEGVAVTGEFGGFGGGGPQAVYKQIAHIDQTAPQRDTAAKKTETLAHLIDGTPLWNHLINCDIIINCVLQDPEKPTFFVPSSAVSQLKPNSLIIDVSCDFGMGFPFAKPTTFEDPMFDVPIGGGKVIHYYAVDHTPSRLFDSASWDISQVICEQLPAMVRGVNEWERHATLRKAIEFRNGEIIYKPIIPCQNREENFPYNVKEEKNQNKTGVADHSEAAASQ